jgi:hypothetical protein
MRWMLVERKPDIVYAGRADLYLGKHDAETEDITCALKFETREAAEAHRRALRHPYDWVAMATSG